MASISSMISSISTSIASIFSCTLATLSNSIASVIAATSADNLSILPKRESIFCSSFWTSRSFTLRCFGSIAGLVGEAATAATGAVGSAVGAGTSSSSRSTLACEFMSSISQSASVSPRPSIVARPSSTVMTCVGLSASQKARSWLITTTAPGNERTASVSELIVSTSKWLLGSSSSRKLCGTSAKHASATRAFSPPDSCPTGRTDLSPLRPSAPMTVRTCVTVSELSTAQPAFCTTSMPRSCIGSSCARSCLKKPSVRPSPSVRVPSSRGSSPLSAASSVLLPAPLGPRTTTRSPFRKARSTPRTIGTSPQPNAAPDSCSCSKLQGGGLGSCSLGRKRSTPSGGPTASALSFSIILTRL
mmetsp:Transcript_13584/g.34283  ORF Transcript_13584/g.34283 Transcript_13584/m.34283 type:complete len:360 (-) Transcript_13584:1042-2121(-)